MTEKEQKRAAREFAAHWQGKGYEKGESQTFWLTLLRDVLGVEHPERHISFEDKVKLAHSSFIDGYIAARRQFPDASLADLYEETTMPPALRQAHNENDRLVMRLYGFKSGMSESDIVARLMERYKELVEK